MSTPFAPNRRANGALPRVLESPHSGEVHPDELDHVPRLHANWPDHLTSFRGAAKLTSIAGAA